MVLSYLLYGSVLFYAVYMKASKKKLSFFYNDESVSLVLGSNMFRYYIWYFPV